MYVDCNQHRIYPILEKKSNRGLSLAVGGGCLKSKLDLFFFSFHGIKDMNGQAASSSS